MSDVERRFHETWLGMVQPVEGLVVSVPVLIDAQCMERQPPHMQQKVLELCPPSQQGDAGPEGYRIADLSRLLQDVLGFATDSFDQGETLPEELSLFVPEGRQTLRPTMALRKQEVPSADAADVSPAAKAGRRYEMLIWDLGGVIDGTGLDLDRPEMVTGTWDYPPAAKFDRLLRHCRVPVGLLTNRDVVRLVYAPHGESSGSISFRLEDMASVGGRPILDAFVMLLAANRFFGVAQKRTLPSLLAESRKRQANVTNDLAEQVFDALQILLRGFEAAAERDAGQLLSDALEREGDHLYRGLLTVLLRLVFVLYAEDRGLLPIGHPTYAKNLSALELFDQLQADHGAYPDSMARRFGAWGRLVTLFRSIFLGVAHGDLTMPPRRGSLFNPHEYPFLEGWGPAGSAPITQPEDRAAVNLPSIDDETVFRVLEKLLMFEGQRLSYRALDVEQIGSVYEALMGYHVVRTDAPAICMRPYRLWVTGEEVLAVPATRRAKWIKETIGLPAAQAQKLNVELAAAEGGSAMLKALAKSAAGGKSERALSRAKLGQLVLQPGSERRRTSSHYTPRSLSAPIVCRTIEPLLSVMGEAPSSERILSLKICDPAMGSGAFLVEACRFLADHVLAAWTREDAVEAIANEHGDPLLHARRLVAQRCLYGVDKNAAAVELAKLSLWLVTLSKSLPFTFLDHSLRHGDSLVGLDFDQLRAFHWRVVKDKKKAPKQLELFGREIAIALDEATALRQRIGSLGDGAVDDREKARLLWDAQDALDRVRLIGDVLVGAFFVHGNDTDRTDERARREELVRAWLGTGGPPTDDLREMQRDILSRFPVFHWMVEFPEVFYEERPDPLDDEQVNRAACMDAFVGNPPFLTGKEVGRLIEPAYSAWLSSARSTTKNADISAHFFRRANELIGNHGALGFIATDKIAQGETRTAGLQPLLADGLCIYSARSSFPWPGAAGVTVAVVHLAKGNIVRSSNGCTLDDEPVPAINSHLSTREEVRDPAKLPSNQDLSFQGVILYPDDGFLVDDEQRRRFISFDSSYSARVRPYIGGDDLNASAEPQADRYAIDLNDVEAPDLTHWGQLASWLKDRVELDRSTKSADVAAHPWWKWWRARPEMVTAVSRLERVLVTAMDPQHFAFAFQGADRVFNKKVCVFALDGYAPFAALQSRIHVTWASYHGRTTGGAGTSSYSNTRCFETFPFPKPDPRVLIPNLEDIGQRLYNGRAKYMVNENVGLTVTYNRLKNPACTDTRILELRALHEELDRAVIAAYADADPDSNWSSVEVPPFCPLTDADKKELEAFENTVIDRLFALNTKRTEEERLKGLSAVPSKPKKRTAKGDGEPTKKSGARKKRQAAPEQLAMPSDDVDS